MKRLKSTAQLSNCTAPELGAGLTAYCFGQASAAERRALEAHLLDCDACWREVRRLEAAVQVLDTEHSLAQSLTPGEVAAAFGPSSKLDLPWGGHWRHALTTSTLYAAIFAVALVVEVAYQFDRYGRPAVIVALLLFGWVCLTTLAGLAVDWKLTLAGNRRAWLAAVSVFALSALGAVLGARGFLPAEPITLLTTQAAPAQAAYLKAVLYCLILNALFLLPPFHFVLTMQRELLAGRHQMALRLLTGDPLGVTPRGASYPRITILVLCFVLFIVVSLYLHHNLMDKLRPDPHLNLFSGLIYARLFLYYALAAEGLAWYARALNELKRECLLAGRIDLRR